MLAWLAELVFASWLLSYGAEHLAERWGARFVGRTLSSVRPTNLAPHLSARCSAPYDKSQLAKTSSANQASINGKLSANCYSTLEAHYKPILLAFINLLQLS